MLAHTSFQHLVLKLWEHESGHCYFVFPRLSGGLVRGLLDTPAGATVSRTTPPPVCN